MNFLSQFLNASDSILQFALLALLLRRSFRRYLTFSLYVAASCAGDVVETIAYYHLGWKSAGYRQVYWTNHIALDLLLFFVVIAFIYDALRESPLRPKAAKVLGIIALAGLVLPFALLPNHHSDHHGPFTSQWFNHVRQILNFAAAIMNLVLWGALLSNRRRDAQLVSLSVGLGILTSSAAIAWGVRRLLSEENRTPVDIFLTIAHIASVILWCSLFRTKETHRPSAAPPSSAAPPDALTTPS